MDELDSREWLLTNGLGSFASGTVCDAHTRTYHGWLIAALEPPGQRTLLLSRIDASLEIGGQVFDLGTNFWTSGAIAPMGYKLLQKFQVDPVPTWIWGWNNWQLRRRLVMPYGLSTPNLSGDVWFQNSVLIDYHYEGIESATLSLRPLVGDRIFHYQQHADSDLEFVQLVEAQSILLQARSPAWVGTSWQLSWSQGRYQPDGMWYWGYRYPEETARGLSDREDLYTPGALTVTLNPGDTITLEARVRSADGCDFPLDAQTVDRAIAEEHQRLRTVFAGLGIEAQGTGSEDADSGSQDSVLSPSSSPLPWPSLSSNPAINLLSIALQPMGRL
ncbi:glycogen debranching enzyme N-terminal domain-containing protein [Egbenema bharatensis]|uniref:glycogen debranching enzyme N-terminal domain-containing protein n=1 Tax=Egbenema bharatensis TaxID=3463334 RepID=UPI003A88AF68